MPWTKDQVKEHKKGLTDAQEEQWVEVANSAYKKCIDEGGTEETCAVSAIKQANSVVERSEEKQEFETRNFDEIRMIENTRTIEGYAIVFNQKSRDLGGFQEIILPGAVDGMIEKSDVLALINHDLNKGVLARSTNGKGSLQLLVDNKGVLYRFNAPNTVLGDELIEGIKRGDIRTSSFAFNTNKEGQEWDISMRPAIRTIKKFTFWNDVSAVYREAYENTTVALRSLDEVRKLTPGPEIKPVIEEPVIEPVIKEKRTLTRSQQDAKKLNDLLKEDNYLNIKRLIK